MEQFTKGFETVFYAPQAENFDYNKIYAFFAVVLPNKEKTIAVFNEQHKYKTSLGIFDTVKILGVVTGIRAYHAIGKIGIYAVVKAYQTPLFNFADDNDLCALMTYDNCLEKLIFKDTDDTPSVKKESD